MNTKFQVGDIVRTTRDSDGPYYKKGALGQLVARTGGQEWHVKFSGMNNPEGSFDPDCDGTWYVSENRFEAAPTAKLTLPIVVGKKYVRRDGKVVPAIHHGGGYDGRTAIWPGAENLPGAVWADNGRVHDDRDHMYDLVSDYIEPAKGHPHAALMMEFAKDAAESETPWKRWEILDGQFWKEMSAPPSWVEFMQYRRKPTVAPDPHAENAAEYAKDMAISDKAWEGWEGKGKNWFEWQALAGHPNWHPDIQFRRKEQA